VTGADPFSPSAADRPFDVAAFEQDDRLRLFAFTGAEKARLYLWTLRAMEHSRANYVVLLHAGEVAQALRELGADHRDQAHVPALSTEELSPLLDQLFFWGLLDRSFDGARATSLAEYRNRHYVYQFSQPGYRAYRAVEDVLGARMDDVTLSRLVLPELLADLHDLAAANRSGDAELVYRKLNRLDTALADMAERAARFYLMLSELSHSTESSAEVFLAHKDALLAHLREFASELERYTPRLAAAVAEVAATGVEDLLERAAEADERIFRTPADRLADWRQRWAGLVHWFTADQGASGTRSEADRLQDGTISAVAAVLALLRRVTEARRGGVSRESQLRHLAAWFSRAPDLDAAHALFGVVFDVGEPRHISGVHPDPELIPTRRSWWEAPPVEISRTLVETGRTASTGAPARVERNDAGRRRLHETQAAAQQARAEAAAGLAASGLADGRVLTEEETGLLLTLLDIALSARVPVSGRAPTTGSSHGVRLTLTPSDASTSVSTVRGTLHLDRMSLVLSGPPGAQRSRTG
jgi:uncharacterized protein (TIGR02677 family)